MLILKRYTFLLKLILGLLCAWVLYYKIHEQLNQKTLLQIKLILVEDNRSVYLWIAVFLMPLNWFLESLKWKKITATLQHISIWQSWASVWAGLCVGNLTPGRFGEFAGRILFFKPEHRAKISLTHFVCGLTQLITTCFFGVPALIYFLFNISGESNALWLFILLACVLFTAFLVLAFVRVNSIYQWLSKRKWFLRFNFGEMNYSHNILVRLIGISVIRYAVFATQYFLLLRFCGSDVGIFNLYIGIAISFMLMSSLPMISFLEVFIRAAIAVMIFGLNDNNSIFIALASTLLWLLNIILPSVIGYFILLFNKMEWKEAQSQC